MEVILLERIEKLGQMGDVVNVKPGFARNYLLPQKKAVTATEASKKQFEARRAQLEAQNLERRKDAEKVAAKLDGLFVIMVRQAGEAGQLYGSVNGRDIADGVTQAGFTVERRQVNLDQPIKNLGLHPVRVALHPEVSVTVTVNVARSAEEAKIQEQTGEAVVRTDEEPEEEAAADVFEAGAAPEEGESAAEEETKA
jgi:large subunit ribosomal protein L9